MRRVGGHLPSRAIAPVVVCGAVLAVGLSIAGPAGAEAIGWQLAQSPGGLAGDIGPCAPRTDRQGGPPAGCPTPQEEATGQDNTIVLQSDGTVLRDPAVTASPVPVRRPRSPNLYLYGPPPERPAAVTDEARPGHSASDAIATTQREELYRRALDRMKDKEADVTVVAPLSSRADRVGSQAEQEINRAQRYELIEKLKDRDDDVDVIVLP